MSSVFSFYIAGSSVQAVAVSTSNGSFTTLETFSFPESELEQFLAGCRGKNFVVCCNPAVFHQHTLHLPPAAQNHYDALVRSELRKIHPEIGSFTTFHHIVGQATIDAKVYNKVATFSYTDDSLSGFLDAFSRQGKEVSHLYAAPFPIFRLGASAPPDEASAARLLIASLPGEKLLLLGENNQLQFIRRIPSPGAALLPEDLPQIRMTLDYCSQSLRVTATEAVLLNQPSTPGEPLPPLTVPLRRGTPELPARLADQLGGYLAPLAAALHYFHSPGAGDILPAQYRSLSRSRKLLAKATGVLCALALLAAGYALVETLAIAELKPGIARIRGELSGAGEALASYQRLDREVTTMQQRLALVRSYHAAQGLASLTALKNPEYSVKAIATQNLPEAMKVRIGGEIAAAGFGETQAIFERIIKQVGALPGYAVTASRLDMKLKTFDIEARCTGAGRQAR